MNNSLIQPTQDNPQQLAIRICRICGESKPYSEMVKNKVFSCGIDTICLVCSRNKVKVWRKENPEKRAEQVKREIGKTYTINKHLRSKYGIDHAQYNELLVKQKESCKICGIHHSLLSKRMAVDHCHETGKIRGLLCSSCNSILGYAYDNTNTLEKAIQYLKDSNDTH